MAHGTYEAGNFNLIRLVGPASEGHEAMDQLAQKAKVGVCPCCVKATHIAEPPSSKLGAYGELENSGMRISADDGPWAGRRLAAVQRVLDSNGSPLSLERVWAAHALECVPPSALIRYIDRGVPVLHAISQESTLQKARDEKEEKQSLALDASENAKR